MASHTRLTSTTSVIFTIPGEICPLVDSVLLLCLRIVGCGSDRLYAASISSKDSSITSLRRFFNTTGETYPGNSKLVYRHQKNMFSPLLLVLTYFGAAQAFYFSSRKIDCVVSEWSEWNDSPIPGKYERYRSVLVHPVNGGKPCPETNETKSDGTNAGVNVDCLVSEWGEWSGPAGFGEYVRLRQILVKQVNAGKACPEISESKSAGIQENNNAANLPTINQTAKLLESNFINSNRFVRSLSSDQDSPSKTRDLLLLIDASGSIGSENFQKSLEGVSDLLRLLCPEPDPFHDTSYTYHQAAAITFDTTVIEQFPFGVEFPTSRLVRAIQSIRYTAGGTCTGDAFRAAITFFASKHKGVRNSKNIQKEVLILTDGQSNCGYNATQAAKELKDKTFSSADDKVKVYGLMIGTSTEAGRKEIKSYVSDPPSLHLFAVSDYDDLLSLVDVTKRNRDKEGLPCYPIEVPTDPLVG